MAADADMDDEAFLAGGEENIRQTKNAILVCSQQRALCIAGLVCGSLLMTALIAAYGGQQSACPCESLQPLNVKSKPFNDSEPLRPVATNGDFFPWIQNNLPTFVKPLSYTLTIHPNLTTHDIKGQVSIALSIEEDTQYIVIHSQNLNVTDRNVMVNGNRGHTIKITKMLEYPPRQQIYMEFKEKLKKKQNYTLNLRWFSKLNTEPEGFYLDHYESFNGIQRSLATTLIEQNGARKYFPCFNEPHLRTPFRISIFRDRFHISLSNANAYKTEDVGFYMGTGLLRDDFMESPYLPTDSITWVISDFERQSVQISSMAENIFTSETQSTNMTTRNETNLKKNLKKLSVRSIASLTHSLNSKIFSTNNSYSLSKVSEISNNSIKQNKKFLSLTFYAPENLLTTAEAIMKTAQDILKYLESWLSIKYPLTKLDFIALPSLRKNFVSSLGIISLKLSFLADLNSTTTKENQLSMLRLAEAVTQQFIGGITSSVSFKDNLIWEGLVKYIAILSLSSLQQYWPLKEMYFLHLATKTMDRDALQGWSSIAHATNNGHKDEFYVHKTVGVFGMLHVALGDTSFKGCLGRFLNDNYFGTAELKRFWISCNKTVDLRQRNIENMMDLWMNQQGFPLLNVSISKHNVTITQHVFKLNDSKSTNDVYHFNISYESFKILRNEYAFKWIFPIKYFTNKGNVSSEIWMNKMEVSFQVPSDTKWIKVNLGQTGLYRVTYSEENWLRLIQVLIKDHHQFSPEDRVGLLSDGFTLCHANAMSCETVMNMLAYLKKETSWGPLTTAVRYLEKWRRILKYSECFLMLSEYVRIQLKATADNFGLIDEGNAQIKMLRPKVLLALILWEDENMITKTKQMFNQYLKIKNGYIPPNLREVIYTGAILSGEYDYWQFCWERFVMLQHSSENYTERMQLVRALGRTKDVWLQNRLLSHITVLPTNEIVEVLQSIAGTPIGGAIACRFLQANWFHLQSRLGNGTLNFAKVISIITQYGATNFDYDELKSIVYRFGDGPGLQILKMAVRSVASNVEWITRSQSSLYKWIEHYMHAN